MAEFGINATEVSPVENFVAPQEGVTERPVLLEGLNDLATQVGSIFQDRKADQQQSFIDQFTQQQNDVVMALEQGTGGVRTLAQARTILRRNLQAAMSAGVVPSGALVEAQNAILGVYGNRQLIQDGTVEQQRREDRREQLITGGFLAYDATDAEFEQADTSARLSVAAQDRWEEQKRTIDMMLAQENVSDLQRQRLEEQRSAEALQFIRSSTSTDLNRLRTQFQSVIDADMSEADKVMNIQDMFSQWRGQANALLGEVAASEFSAFLAPFEQLEQQFIQRATGELDDAALKRDIDRTMAVAEQLALEDPEVVKLAVGSQIFNDAVFQRAISNNNASFQAALRFLSGGQSGATNPDGTVSPEQAESPFTTSGSTIEGMNAYLSGVLRGLDSDNEELRAEAEQRVVTFFDSIEDYEGMIRRNPEAGIALVNFMASNEFLKARTNNPDIFNELGPVAQEVLSNHYFDEVWGMVSGEFRNNMVEVLTNEMREIPRVGVGIMGGATGGTDTRNIVEQSQASQLVGARETPSGMEFYPLITGQSSGAIEARAKAAQLNTDLASVINTTLKAAAHLEGRTDYGNLWVETANDILGGGMVTDTGDDLSLENFRQGSSILEQAASNANFVGSGDFSGAETPAEVAAAFTGLNETEHKDVISSFIRNAVGTDIDPSKTAWCAAFINAALGASGGEGTGKLTARSFLNWGNPVDNPQQGDVVVFRRGNSEWQGHVGFYMGKDANGNIRVLGGNQSDQVSVQTYSAADLLGYRRG